MKTKHVLSIRGLVEEAAKLAGDQKKSTSTVRRYDTILEPMRTERGHRIYNRDKIFLAACLLHPEKMELRSDDSEDENENT